MKTENLFKSLVESEVTLILLENGGIEKNFGKISKLIEKNLDRITNRVSQRISETKNSVSLPKST
jgi:hypothetical protein